MRQRTRAERRASKPEGALVEQIRKHVRKHKENHPYCAECGHKWPSFVLEFDHLDHRQKLFNIGDSRAPQSIEALYIEIAKCQLVCANCHKIREMRRRHKSNSKLVLPCNQEGGHNARINHSRDTKRRRRR